MPPPTEERLATIEQVLRDVRDDIHDLREEQKADHHRLRTVESIATKLAESHRVVQERRDLQLRKLSIRIQWIGLAVAGASFAAGIVIGLFAH